MKELPIQTTGPMLLATMAFAAGFLISMSGEAVFPVVGPESSPGFADLILILRKNLTVLAIMFSGAVISAGALGAIVLLSNAFVMGFDVVALWRVSGEGLCLMMTYLPGEFIGMCLGVSAGTSLGVRVLRAVLFSDEPCPFPRRALGRLVWAFGLIVCSAVIEVMVMRLVR
jgi:hypothetical protein